MANPEHLAILKQGVEAWNAWRTNPGVWPSLPDLNGAEFQGESLIGANFREANLFGIHLGGANLFGADLRSATLEEANLAEANLEEARLAGAHLRMANLRGAVLKSGNLAGATLRGADITGANLSKADLAGATLMDANLTRATLHAANLTHANLRGANLTGAHLDRTVLGQVILADVIGLDSCRHDRPSVIDFATLQLSGPLPLAFLRGCGLPDEVINYLPSLLNQPIQFYACFISYSSRDEAFAQRLYADLQNKGVRCWFAPEDLKIGDKLRERIDESIQFYDKLLLILSEHSLASDWVEHEVEVALRKERGLKRAALFPIRLDDTIFKVKAGWANDVLIRHIGDFRTWKDHDAYQTAFDRLLRDLKADAAPPPSA